jgi:5-formyltetrahydrofolate cyclo-ligase
VSRDEPEPIPVDFSEDDHQRQDPAPAKRALRRSVARLAASMSADERFAASERVCRTIERLPAFASARSVAMYSALEDEVDLSALMVLAIESGRDVLLPVTDVEQTTMRFVSVENPARGLKEGAFGILEPRLGMPLGDVSRLGLVLVPGSAFDAGGGRLGRGGGYYDRFLSMLKPLRSGGPAKIGIGFSCQLVESVPVGPRDVALDYIVTEDGVLACAGNSGV